MEEFLSLSYYHMMSVIIFWICWLDSTTVSFLEQKIMEQQLND